MLDPDPKCRHFDILCILSNKKSNQIFPIFRLFPTFRLSDCTALIQTSDTVFVNSTNTSTNIEAAMLSMHTF